MFATVALGVGSRSMALAVPRSAIIEDGDRRLLYVEEEEGKYEEKVVELGRMQADLVEVISGLDRGSRVVTKGAFVLKSEKAKGELKGHGH
jgi:Cu(I)/Ag(I) efflux system membrane fusion protein